MKNNTLNLVYLRQYDGWFAYTMGDVSLLNALGLNGQAGFRNIALLRVFLEHRGLELSIRGGI